MIRHVTIADGERFADGSRVRLRDGDRVVCSTFSRRRGLVGVVVRVATFGETTDAFPETIVFGARLEVAWPDGARTIEPIWLLTLPTKRHGLILRLEKDREIRRRSEGSQRSRKPKRKSTR